LLIKSAIESIAHKTTLVVIAHRLSTIVNADFIYVLQKGRIVEQGNYDSLTILGGAFRHAAGIQRIFH
jgi:ABC-type multidrug transport system fused ATPase/permease subunit